MHQYRIYTFRDDGHFSCVQRIECADEREAVQKARQLVNRQDGELWESDQPDRAISRPYENNRGRLS